MAKSILQPCNHFRWLPLLLLSLLPLQLQAASSPPSEITLLPFDWPTSLLTHQQEKESHYRAAVTTAILETGDYKVQESPEGAPSFALQLSLGRLGSYISINGSILRSAESTEITRDVVVVSSLDDIAEGLRVVTLRLLGKTVPMPTEIKTLGLEGRVLVLVKEAAKALVDAGGKSSIEKAVANRVQTETGLAVVSQEEIAELLTIEANRQALGSGSETMIEDFMRLSKARFAVALSIGNIGEATSVAASLYDADEKEPLGRTTLILDDATQIQDAAISTALGLFGKAIRLPAPASEQSPFERELNAMAKTVQSVFGPQQTSLLSRLAILPLANRGSGSQKRQLGVQISEYLENRLATNYKLPLVSESRLEELSGIRPLDSVASMDMAGRMEVGQFLGASMILTGTVADLSEQFLIHVQLVDSKTGKVLHASHGFVPKGVNIEALEKVFVKRSVGGALFRSVIPGWGQFYNDSPIKGSVILGAVAGSIAASLYFSAASNSALSNKAGWDPGGNDYLNQGCLPGNEGACLNEQSKLQESSETLATNALISAGIGALFYVAGFVDAGVNAL